MSGRHDRLSSRLGEWGDPALTLLLLALGAALIGAALFIRSPLLKAAIAAWVILP